MKSSYLLSTSLLTCAPTIELPIMNEPSLDFTVPEITPLKGGRKLLLSKDNTRRRHKRKQVKKSRRNNR